MPSRREQMEDCTLSELFDVLAADGPGGHEYQSASAELQRRRFVAQEELEKTQIAAADAQIEAAQYAKQTLEAMRRNAFWTAVRRSGQR